MKKIKTKLLITGIVLTLFFSMSAFTNDTQKDNLQAKNNGHWVVNKPIKSKTINGVVFLLMHCEKGGVKKTCRVGTPDVYKPAPTHGFDNDTKK